MRLTPEQEQQVRQSIHEQDLRCSGCGSQDFVIGEPSVTLGSGIIMIPLRCRNGCVNVTEMPMVEQDGRLVAAPVEDA